MRFIFLVILLVAPSVLSAAPVSCTSSSQCSGMQKCVRKVCADGSAGSPCESTTDCKGSGFCKEAKAGKKFCMNKNPAGAPCSTSIDCGSGLFCKEKTCK